MNKVIYLRFLVNLFSSIFFFLNNMMLYFEFLWNNKTNVKKKKKCIKNSLLHVLEEGSKNS